MLTAPRRVLVVASTFPASPTDESPAFVRDLVVALKEHQPECEFAVLAPQVGRDMPAHVRHAQYDEFRFPYAWPATLQRLSGRGILPALTREPWLIIVVPLLFIGEFIALWQLVRTWHPDVIHAHWFTPQGVVAALVSRLSGVPFVLTTHASDVSIWERVPVVGRWVVRRALPRAHRITAVSTQTLARARRFFTEDEWAAIVPRTRVIPMGVALAGTSPARASHGGRGVDSTCAPIILFIGRLAAKKGVPVLVDAVARLQRPDVRLVIAGSGPEREAIGRAVVRAGLAGQVEFPGFVSGEAKDALIERASVIVVPSVETDGGDAEGLPVVVLEALAAGRPCVATDATGAADVITSGENGWLVPQRDPDALAGALREVLGLDDAARASVAARAKASMVPLAWPTVASRHWEFLFADLPG
ncbi:MAG: glycosyltransferase [Gemmatimonadaceae bacterium]